MPPGLPLQYEDKLSDQYDQDGEFSRWHGQATISFSHCGILSLGERALHGPSARVLRSLRVSLVKQACIDGVRDHKEVVLAE